MTFFPLLCAAAATFAFVATASGASRHIFRDAMIIPLAAADTETVAFEGYLEVAADGRLLRVQAGDPPTADLTGAEVTTLAGRIVIPGFLSAHSHLWQSGWRGVAPEKQLYGWLAALHWTIRAHFTPGDLFTFTRHGAADYLRHGVTTVFNHSQNLGFSEALNLEQLEGAMTVPQRLIHAYAFANDTPVAVIEAQITAFLARADELKAANPRFLGPAISTDPVAFNPALQPWWREFSRDRGWLTQFHLLESPERTTREATPVSELAAAGLFTDRTVVAHFIQTTPDMVAVLARQGSAMSWNPLSNGRLASGLADVVAYRAQGLGIAMGLDGQASADLADPFENMRLGLYATRMVHKSAEIMSPLDVLRLHTIETARLLGVADRVGSLEPGKFADFLVLDPKNPPTGRVAHPVEHVVFALGYGNLESVYLGGERVVSRGDIAGLDDAALDAEAVTRAKALAQRVGRK